MRTFSYLLTVVPFLASLTDAKWYVDFSKNGCKNEVLSGVLTVSGTKKDFLNECYGGATYKDGTSNTRSVHVKGISGTGLQLTMYAARSCDPASSVVRITKDGCYTSSTGDPLNYLVMRQK